VDTAVLIEIESLRRASLAALRERYREVFSGRTRVRHRGHLFRRIAWRLQRWPKEISPNGHAGEHTRSRAMPIVISVPTMQAWENVPLRRLLKEKRTGNSGKRREPGRSRRTLVWYCAAGAEFRIRLYRARSRRGLVHQWPASPRSRMDGWRNRLPAVGWFGRSAST